MDLSMRASGTQKQSKGMVEVIKSGAMVASTKVIGRWTKQMDEVGRYT